MARYGEFSEATRNIKRNLIAVAGFSLFATLADIDLKQFNVWGAKTDDPGRDIFIALAVIIGYLTLTFLVNALIEWRLWEQGEVEIVRQDTTLLELMDLCQRYFRVWNDERVAYPDSNDTVEIKARNAYIGPQSVIGKELKVLSDFVNSIHTGKRRMISKIRIFKFWSLDITFPTLLAVIALISLYNGGFLTHDCETAFPTQPPVANTQAKNKATPAGDVIEAQSEPLAENATATKATPASDLTNTQSAPSAENATETKSTSQ